MAETIKKHKDIAFIVGIGLILTIAGIVGMFGMKTPVLADVATTVTVTAEVYEWLTFTISTTSVTLTPNLVDAGGATHVASSSAITLTIGTNSADGWSVTANGTSTLCTNGGLESGTQKICQPSATSTLTEADDNDGYGANATATYAGVDIKDNYDYYDLADPWTVGELDATSTEFADCVNCTHAATNVVDMRIYAECDGAQPAASDYTDTATLTALPSS